MKTRNLLRGGLFALLLLIGFSPEAKAFTAVVSGNWSVAATWGGVAPGATVANSDIIIPAGITVNLDMDVSFAGLLNTFSVGGTLNNTSAYAVTITQGSLAGAGAISISSMTFGLLATTSFTGTLTVDYLVNNGATLLFAATASVSDTLNLIAGSIALNSGANFTVENNSTIKVNNGTITINGGVFNSSNSYNVMYVGTTKTSAVELNTITLNNLYVQLNDNTQALTLAGNLAVNGSLIMTGGNIDFSGKSLTLNGNISRLPGTAFTSTALSSLTIDGNAVLTSGFVFSAGSALLDFTIDNSSLGDVKLESALNIAGTLGVLDGNFTLETGSTLTMNAGSTIEVADGDLTPSGGVFVGTAAYDVEYSGGNNASGIELEGSGLNDVSISLASAPSQITLSDDVTVEGDLDMSMGKINLNGNDITLNGTLQQTAAASFVGNSLSDMTLSLSSAGNDTIYFDVSNQNLNNLTVNLTTATSVVLGSGLSIITELILTSGSLDISNYDLTIQSAGAISGYNETQYVTTSGTGSLAMYVNSASTYVVFPVGTTLNFSPASVQQTAAGTSAFFMARVMNGVWMLGTSGTNLATTLSVVDKTWIIEAGSGATVDMNLKLAWVAASEVNGFLNTSAYISHYTFSAWDTYIAGSAVAGLNTTFELERSNITSLSPFSVAEAGTVLETENEITSGNLQIYPNPAHQVLNVEFANESPNYSIEIMDLMGRTVLNSQNESQSGTVDISALDSGSYFIRVSDAGKTNVTVKKFIKI